MGKSKFRPHISTHGSPDTAIGHAGPDVPRTVRYRLHQTFAPAGDQPEAIEKLTEGVSDGLAFQTLLGVTGSGKTYTMAHVIARLGCPALIMAPNKTLAAQLYSEMREFFPENAVEYFVSYYNYYQPEAYVPSKDLYIEKTPQTFMNESGKARPARPAARCAIPLESVIAIHDEIDLPFGEIRSQARRRRGRAQRAQEPEATGWAATTSGGSGSASGGPTRPTPRSSPPTCSGASPSPRSSVAGADRRGGRRGRAAD